MSKSRLAIVTLAGVLVALQFVPVERENPPVSGDVDAPPPVDAILRRSCYDCHSNETRWPWYAKVAPISWLVARDVNDGREHLNFSEWTSLPAGEKRHELREVWEEVEAGEMPLALYLFMHGDARLGPADLEALHDWTLGAGQDAVDREEERGG
ncbi:MAG: heme-binding domain-containing protein [Planctomycetota bacterium JB042]